MPFIILATSFIPETSLADHLPGIDPIAAGGNYSHTDHSFHDHSGENLAGINLDDTNLTGADFSGSDLTDAGLYRANLSAATFTNGSLESADARSATVTGAVFTGANLTRTNFFQAVGVTGPQIQSALSVNGITLVSADLQGADLSGLDLSYASFSNALLAGADFSGSDLSNGSLLGADLSGAILTGADLTAASLYSVTGLGGAQLRSALSVQQIGLDIDLAGEDLSGLDLTGAILEQVVFSGANLSGAILVDARLLSADLIGADLTNADLTGAQNLEPEQLATAASIAGATLSTLSLVDLDLTGFDLTNTVLTSVDIQGADLSGTTGLPLAAFDSLTWYDDQTVFPVGFDPVAFGLTHYRSSPLYTDIKEIATSLDPIPGMSAPFGAFTNGFWYTGLDMNDAGQVAFEYTTVFSGAVSTGIYVGDGNILGAVVDFFGDPVPGMSGSFFPYDFRSGDSPAIDASGDVAFSAELNPPAYTSGVFRYSGGAGSTIAIEGDDAPVPGGGVYEEIATSECVDTNDAGTTIFSAQYAPAGGRAQQGIFADMAGVHSAVFLEGEVAPGTGGGTYTFLFSVWNPRCGQINESGQVVAVLDVLAGTSNEGIFLDSAGIDSVVALQGDPAPGTGGGTFADFVSINGPRARINANGDVVFTATVDGGSVDHGIFLYRDGATRLVAGPGQSAPATGSVYSSVFRPSLNDAGHVVFLAAFATRSGIFLDVDGAQIAVALSGTVSPSASGARYSHFGDAKPKINNEGEVAFAAVLDIVEQTAGGTTLGGAIYRVPEPTSNALLGLGVLMLVRLSRRSASSSREASPGRQIQ